MLTVSTFHVDIVYMRKPLHATTLLMLVGLAGALLGMIYDPRMITGVSAWLKPAKFAVSTAIFAATIAWILTYLKPSRRMTIVATTLSVVLVFEVGVIFIQAYRGTTSHFNVSSRMDEILFGAMGLGIGILWVSTICVFVASMKQTFDDKAWGWAIRLGLLITVIGSAAGGLMLRETPEQAQHAAAQHSLQQVGGHTVGAEDGGPGIPGLGWSTQHGDLRIPHFFGLHAIQVLPLFAWAVRRRRRQTMLVFTAASSYLAFIGILSWQALRGESIVQSGSETLTALGLGLVATVVALTISQMETTSHESRPVVQSL
jgi:hypothetical protein